jgi:tetratricopeptide (TPR) repeat protein
MADNNKNRIAADCWKKGNDAALSENFDYAIDMLSSSVKLVPDNRLYRETLRGVERKKYRDNKKGAKMAGLSIKTTQMSIAKARHKEEWEKVDQLAESVLKLNPWHPQLNADMAEACNKQGYKDCAIFGYKTALANDPDNKEFNKALAYLLEEKGEYMEAIECWNRIYKLEPTNGEARSKMTQLAAMKVMDRGGYQTAENLKDVKTGYDYHAPGKMKGEEVEGPGMSLEADMQRAIRKNPADADLYVKLADFYRRENRLQEAAETLETALSVKPSPNTREKLEDVQLDILRQNLGLAKQNASANPDDEIARKNSAELARELLNREIEVFSKRVESYPADRRLKFDLGQLFMRRQNFPDAIKLFQQAAGDSRIEGERLAALGECFVREKKGSLAIRNYELAVEKINAHDNADVFKKVHYTLARLYEESGQREKAEAHYTEVLGVDYEYRDTLKRLEDLQAGGGGQA